MIIDSHVHLPPLGIPQKWDALLDGAAKNKINLMLVSHLGDWSGYPAAQVVREANAAAKAFADYAKGRVLWQAYLNPQLDNWREELENCIKNGACGIKLWISLKDNAGSLGNTIAVLQSAGQYKLPVLIHTFNRTDRNRPGEISIREFVQLSCSVPDCVMIAAHAGGNWRQSLEMLKKCGENVYLDISGGYPDYEMLTTLCRTEGAERLLFGSDALGRSFASQTAKVIFADIDEHAKAGIFWKNAKKVYNIENIPALNGLEKKTQRKTSLPDLTEEHFCFCGFWPFWESPCRNPETLNQILTENHIRKAYTGSLDGIFRLDLLAANRKFLKSCKGLDRIAPLATLNPAAHNWRQLVSDTLEQGFAGGLISPYLHNWRLDDPTFTDFFQACAAAGLKLWVNCDLADHRFRHVSLAARPVAADELSAFMRGAPVNCYVFQGICPQNIMMLSKQFSNDQRFRFEFSRLTDSQTAIQDILSGFGEKRLVAGSEFPFRHIKETRYVIRERKPAVQSGNCKSNKENLNYGKFDYCNV